VSRAPAGAVNASSSTVYGDRDSRLPVAIAATAHVPSTSAYGDWDSRLPVATLVSGSEIAALDRATAARASALLGLAGVDWSGAAGDVYGLRDSRPPLAPFNMR
jgi:hypothetical protein